MSRRAAVIIPNFMDEQTLASASIDDQVSSATSQILMDPVTSQLASEDNTTNLSVSVENTTVEQTTSSVALVSTSQNSQPQLAAQSCRIPVFVVDILPNKQIHLGRLSDQIGHSPSVRNRGNEMRFTPRTMQEFNIVQQYFLEEAALDPNIKLGFTFTPANERPYKVAIKGLPKHSNHNAISEALHDMVGVKPINIRFIPPRSNSNRVVYFVMFPHLSQDALERLLGINELLCVQRITVKEWQPQIPQQCHNCQKYGHSSKNCFREKCCLWCAGPHSTRQCQSERSNIICANCGLDHPANHRSCTVYICEARNRGLVQNHQGGFVATRPARNSQASRQQRSIPTLEHNNIQGQPQQMVRNVFHLVALELRSAITSGLNITEAATTAVDLLMELSERFDVTEELERENPYY